jgi:hypothetical protein
MVDERVTRMVDKRNRERGRVDKRNRERNGR